MVEDALQLAVVLGDQRIGRRDRRVGDAGDHRAEAEERVLDAVAGEDRDRPLHREAAVDDPLRDAAGDVARLGVGHPAPGAALPLGEEHSGRRGPRPMVEPVGHRFRIGSERVGRPHDHRAVGAALDGHVRRTEGQRNFRHRFLPHTMFSPLGEPALNRAFIVYPGLPQPRANRRSSRPLSAPCRGCRKPKPRDCLQSRDGEHRAPASRNSYLPRYRLATTKSSMFGSRTAKDRSTSASSRVSARPAASASSSPTRTFRAISEANSTIVQWLTASSSIGSLRKNAVTLLLVDSGRTSGARKLVSK